VVVAVMSSPVGGALRRLIFSSDAIIAKAIVSQPQTADKRNCQAGCGNLRVARKKPSLLK